MIKKAIAVLVVTLTLTSCSISTFYAQNEAAEYTPTKKEEIKLYSHNSPKEYIVVGSMAIDVNGSPKVAEAYLKKKASALGADAVIFCKLNKLNSFTSRTGISGVAVKFK
ncbi:hypothetical protein FFWV33_06455 [Flavobacterium faecale]|uniref:YdgH/BhsA/McbA-like domain-containing protein n=2 Tax=Flavobacterium faecale TaxID=1355330 RepID=A0A2S1LBR9_9FLAO|nr:hypothetical protein FFWV33_06455 [Flavobacterium faecale]